MTDPHPMTTPDEAARVAREVRRAVDRALRAEVDPVLSFRIEHRQREREAAVEEAVRAILAAQQGGGERG